jgi:hypothetical protein
LFCYIFFLIKKRKRTCEYMLLSLHKIVNERDKKKKEVE